MDDFDQYEIKPENNDFSQYEIKSNQPSSGMNMTLTDTPSGVPQYDLSRVANALGGVESSGKYDAVGVPVKGKRAYGKYQIMEQNVPAWSKEVLGREVSLDEFRNNPQIQDAIAQGKIDKLLKEGNSIQDVASIWLSGKPLKGNNRKDLGTGISVPEYVKRFNEFYNNPDAIKQSQEHPQLWKLAQSINSHPELNKLLGNIAPSQREIENISTFAAPLLGGLQGLNNTTTSIANFPLDLVNGIFDTNAHINPVDLSQSVGHGDLNNALFGLGQLGSEIAGAGGTFNALGNVPKLASGASALATPLRGLLTGAAVDDEGIAGRTGGAALGGLLSSVPNLVRLKGKLNNLTNKSIANRIVNDAKNQTNKSSDAYQDIFNDVYSGDVVIPNEAYNYKKVRKYFNPNDRVIWDKYLFDPSVENAHRVKSALGDAKRSLDQVRARKGDLSPGQNDRLEKILSLKNSFKNEIHGLLKDYELSDKYIKAQSDFRKNVVPYRIPEIEKYSKGKIWANDLLKSLKSNRAFLESEPGKRYAKSLKINRILNNKLTHGLGALGTGSYFYNKS